MGSFSFRISLVLVLALVLSGIASAGTTTYTSQSAFSAATSGLTTLTFDGIAPAGGFNSYGVGPLVLSGVTITGNGSMFVIDQSYYGSAYSGGGYLNSDYAANGVDEVVFALPAPVTAVGFNYGGLLGGPVTFDVTLDAMGPFSFTTSQSITGTSSLDFLGITSTTAFSTVVVDMPDFVNYNAIDNFQFGSSTPTPEPASLVLFGAGVLAIGKRIRRK
jgi:PEP-CTERM motif